MADKGQRVVSMCPAITRRGTAPTSPTRSPMLPRQSWVEAADKAKPIEGTAERADGHRNAEAASTANGTADGRGQEMGPSDFAGQCIFPSAHALGVCRRGEKHELDRRIACTQRKDTEIGERRRNRL